MPAAKFTRMKIYIGRNKSLSNTVQIYDVTYTPRQAALVGYIDSTHRREWERPWASKIPFLHVTRPRI